MTLGMLLASTAFAAGSSLEVELVHPRFVEDTTPGVDALGDGDKGELHTGIFASYTHDPLLLQGEGGIVQGVERNRLTLDLGGAAQLTRGLAFRAAFPIVSDWGTQRADLSAPGVGFGDAWLGVVFGVPRIGPVRLGGAVDVALPIGTRDAWRGETSARVAPGLMADLRLGRLSAAASGTLLARSGVDTGTGLQVGMEALAGLGVGWDVWLDHARVTVSLTSRTGLDSQGEGASALELLGALDLRVSRTTRFATWVGRGLNLGYGAPDYRVGLGVTVHARRTPDRPEPEPIVAVLEDPPRIAVEPLEDEPEPEPPPPPEPPAMARVEHDQIVIRDPVQFELGSDRILPESLPILHSVAEILRDHPEILEVVIEGHASEEGSFLYNYDLSMRRSSAIFKELVLAGVHPTRLACRSMGEVQPATMGQDEAELARSRRVVFHITKRWNPGDPIPSYTRDIRVPWTGEAQTIPEGPPLEVPVEPPPAPVTPKKDSDVPDERTFEEEDP